MCKLTILFIHIKHAIVEMYLSVQCCCCTVHSTVTALSYKSTREEWNKCNKCYKFFNNKRQLNEKKWNEMKRNANKRKEKKRKPPWKKTSTRERRDLQTKELWKSEWVCAQTAAITKTLKWDFFFALIRMTRLRERKERERQCLFVPMVWDAAGYCSLRRCRCRCCRCYSCLQVNFSNNRT